MQVDDNEAFDIARDLASKEAILSGMSAGANVLAALQIARRPENKGKLIVVRKPRAAKLSLLEYLSKCVVSNSRGLVQN